MFTAGTVKAADLQNRFCDRFSGLPLRSRNPRHQTCVLRPPLTGAALFCFPRHKGFVDGTGRGLGPGFPCSVPGAGTPRASPLPPGAPSRRSVGRRCRQSVVHITSRGVASRYLTPRRSAVCCRAAGRRLRHARLQSETTELQRQYRRVMTSPGLRVESVGWRSHCPRSPGSSPSIIKIRISLCSGGCFQNSRLRP